MQRKKNSFLFIFLNKLELGSRTLIERIPPAVSATSLANSYMFPLDPWLVLLALGKILTVFGGLKIRTETGALSKEHKGVGSWIFFFTSFLDDCEPVVAATGCRPLPIRLGTAGKKLFERGNYPPPLPTGIGQRYCLTISNLGHAAFFRRCELPL